MNYNTKVTIEEAIEYLIKEETKDALALKDKTYLSKGKSRSTIYRKRNERSKLITTLAKLNKEILNERKYKHIFGPNNLCD